MTRSILLDTHTLLWLLNDEKLGPIARALIAEAWPDANVLVSAFSFWEVAMLVRKRRMTLLMPLLDWRRQVLAKGLRELPVTGEIAILSETMVDFHPDPADRLIAATAMHHRVTLLTSDEAIMSWAGALERVDAKS